MTLFGVTKVHLQLFSAEKKNSSASVCCGNVATILHPSPNLPRSQPLTRKYSRVSEKRGNEAVWADLEKYHYHCKTILVVFVFLRYMRPSFFLFYVWFHMIWSNMSCLTCSLYVLCKALWVALCMKGAMQRKLSLFQASRESATLWCHILAWYSEAKEENKAETEWFQNVRHFFKGNNVFGWGS